MSPSDAPLPPIYTAETYDAARNIARHLIDIGTELRAAIDRRSIPLGISGPQWVVLVRIASGVDTSAAELCRTIGYDSGSMTRMLDRLEKRGLIYRRRSIEDRRVVRLSLTDLGKELYPQLTPIAIETLNHVLKGFTPEEADILMGLLDRILANANTA
ncbi:MarR family winged helix-turn-helix transcriptional regulator [Rhodospirillum rubrum]|uniref:Transcriptional regulator, MarR family n=1 Tax=Rhodospirillum rubrum (strain ATCC 11170 / ATH 1.1.1 / DSM 467 / LMG 4362 / NCIMB 8255 / S1) TaxID=269796 RepID=Q2RW33_RHORT|nr:MarR family transcriptional regulator [Rhodospirillum rubrum]ABC21662.1 transcriptional regulator, MarR family [Rhodospirillum rubrum ATCC 11170]AEO47360.1 MarR family transcriptional regulator [Rhodospirillum rubrum F11]MBK5953213.1 MarR family transcriptional regulator [Rhodospirillum rubrum]QXG81328.1 MarR family transcriptional regulator [Rhodospirillum rubrum]